MSAGQKPVVKDSWKKNGNGTGRAIAVGEGRKELFYYVIIIQYRNNIEILLAIISEANQFVFYFF